MVDGFALGGIGRDGVTPHELPETRCQDAAIGQRMRPSSWTSLTVTSSPLASLRLFSLRPLAFNCSRSPEDKGSSIGWQTVIRSKCLNRIGPPARTFDHQMRASDGPQSP